MFLALAMSSKRKVRSRASRSSGEGPIPHEFRQPGLIEGHSDYPDPAEPVAKKYLEGGAPAPPRGPVFLTFGA
jgi:hypothetical protein